MNRNATFIIKRTKKDSKLKIKHKFFLKEVKKNNKKTNEEIFDFWKNSSKKNSYKFRYNSPELKRKLSIECQCRCPFCGVLLDLTIPAKCEKQNLSQFTIEHIKPKSKYPLMIYEEKNMISSCLRCNGIRDDEFYSESYINIINTDIVDFFAFDYCGVISCNSNLNKKKKEKIESLIKIYSLNDDKKRIGYELVNRRMEFMMILLNQNYKKLLELYIKYTDIKCLTSLNSIEFYTMFLYNERRKKK